ncbi:MAG: hypothetical protein CMD16_02850 [Flavobacteriales bacterium]|nr:hypothetical protein [Flavobacteriales bacterium]|tara:strand:- start:83594 stop:87427 length:3834 start_codon:yes stop_codon:yes gene_type:complete
MKRIIILIIIGSLSLLCFGQQPTNLSVSNINATNVMLNWDNGGCNTSNYSLRYKADTALTWQAAIQVPNTNGPETYHLIGLTESTTYNWKVKCGGNWSFGNDFTTISNNCNKSLTQRLNSFNPNPVYNLWVWSFDTLTLTNTSNCDIRVRPEFDVYHDSIDISQGDFDLKWFSPLGNWPNLNYNIDSNGHAYGYWSFLGDTTGQIISQGDSVEVIIKVRFRPGANYGTYYANWITQELDSIGNFIQTIGTSDSTSLSFVDCSIYKIDSTNTTNVTCSGSNNGSASILSIQNGSNEYLYNWSNGGTANSISNLSPGNYHCIVTDQNWQQCIDSISFTISEPSTLSITENTVNVSCYGDSNGVANLTITGGTSPYTQNWNGSSQYNLGEGIYFYTVTDSNYCLFSDSIYISQPPQLTSSIISTDISSCISANGSIDLTINGGTGDYSFIWSNGATSEDLSNLSAGTYYVTISDTNNCSINNNATINDSSSLASSYTQTNISCFGANDGSAIVNFFGGTIGVNPGDTNYILGWAGFTTVLYNPLTEFNTALVSPSGVPAGVYPYSATDLNGCTIYDTITIIQPDSLYTAYSTTNHNGFEISCNGLSDGEIDIQINGGTSPFDNYLNNILQNSQLTIGLPAGAYLDSIVDANGCTATNNIILNEPTALISTPNISHITCNQICDGEIISNASGGIYPYSFSWDGGITWSSIDNLDSLCVGNYNLSITDDNGCIENIAPIQITEPNEINLNIDSLVQITTYGGNNGLISISSNGGTAPYSYSWSSDNSFSSSSEDISSLTAGFYYLEIADINSCIYLDTFELSQPALLWVSLDNVINANCYNDCNGSIDITANGGDSTYLYSWIGPNGFSSNNDDINNLCYGEYIITINDGFSNVVDTFNIYQPQPITSVLTTDSILCYNGTAQVSINVWGGTQPFTYNWSNSDNSYSTVFSAGNHSINVTDINGCNFSESFNLSNPDSIISSPSSIIHNDCFSYNDGSVSIGIINGGTQPFTFSIDNGNTYQNSNTFNSLFAGSYSFLISDANNCLSSTTADVYETDAITSTITTTEPSCYGYCDGSVYTITSGGTPPYTYNWNNGTNNLCAGLHNVTILDVNGCLEVNSTTMNEPSPILINVWINGNDLVATSGFLSYEWFDNNNNPIPGGNSSTFTPIGNGSYYVTVTDTNGCSEDSYIIDYNISSIEYYSLSSRIFPNPTTGKVKIKSDHNIESISVYNSIGNQLIIVNNKNNTQTDTEIDLSTFAKGVYYMRINTNNQIINQRIILQ